MNKRLRFLSEDKVRISGHALGLRAKKMPVLLKINSASHRGALCVVYTYQARYILIG